MTQSAHQAEATARAAWPDLARVAGLDPAPYGVQVLRTRVLRGEIRTVMVAEAAGQRALILKHAPAEDEAWFDSQIEAHRRAEGIFVAGDGLAVPHLLATDRARRVVLMTRVPGVTVHDAMLAAPGATARLRLLEACGRWVGRLHAGGEVKFGRVRPDPVLERISRWRAEVHGGAVSVPDEAVFFRLADRAAALAEAARDRKTTRVVVHGDMNLRNLLVSGEGDAMVVSGIDFGTTGLQSASVDLARLLVRHATFFGPSQDAKAQDDWAAANKALLAGHGGRWRDTVELEFLVHADLLRLWQSIPRNPVMRSLIEHRRWAGIRHLAARLLDGA